MHAGPAEAITLPHEARLVVVSDTHMPRMAKQLPLALRVELEEADGILHAGDFVSYAAVDALEAYAPVIGVAGNNDDDAIRARFPGRQVIAWSRHRIGLVHGHDGPGRTTPERALAAFAEDDVDIVVFGHSHIPLQERRGGVLLFNPGSPTDRRRQPRYSFGVLDARGGLSARHVYFETK